MYEFYVTIVGARQGAFKGEAPSERHAGKLVGLAYDQGSAAAVSAGGRRGKVTHQPVRFTKQWGAASPQLLEALETGERLTSVVFEFLRTTDEGEEEVFHRVTLHGAVVAELRSFVDLDAEPSALMPLPALEDVTLAFSGMVVENLAHGTSATLGDLPKAAGRKPIGKVASKAAATRRGTRARR
ncbi:Hcp family type VI secretion system effector [Elioraea rosea]|uniref:type VI secretion system tube protein Hcp n=1 Tax=Elioraea rosea TaxID=2492390 RepID=UPI00118240B2|nr:type VI secretion system tube protein Hcp [Elioraea rosea]